jgi:hypothetical protein
MSLDRRHVERDLNTRRLLPAVEALLETFSYAELSVEQMVAAADISRSTFYNYFEDKNDLLGALAAGAMGALIEASRPSGPRSRSAHTATRRSPRRSPISAGWSSSRGSDRSSFNTQHSRSRSSSTTVSSPRSAAGSPTSNSG